MSCALFAACPELSERLRHRPLGRFPTPLERVRGLLPDSVELWCKRDDRSGGCYGGNKVRKLEFLLAHPALGDGDGERRRILTFGGYGSHHVLACARYARELGLRCDAVLCPQPLTDHASALLAASRAAGARLYPAWGLFDLPARLLAALCADGPALLVPPGGSSPLGTLGWLSGGLEIAAQVRLGVAPRFDAVYVALGSGGTAAGLWLGLGRQETAAELVAVRVVPAAFGNRPWLRWLARRTAALLGPAARRLPKRPLLRIDGRFYGPGYGHPTPAAQAAVARAAQAGLALETTYTGRVLAALLGDAACGRLAGKRVLFVHTYGGLPLDL